MTIGRLSPSSNWKYVVMAVSRRYDFNDSWAWSHSIIHSKQSSRLVISTVIVKKERKVFHTDFSPRIKTVPAEVAPMMTQNVLSKFWRNGYIGRDWNFSMRLMFFGIKPKNFLNECEKFEKKKNELIICWLSSWWILWIYSIPFCRFFQKKKLDFSNDIGNLVHEFNQKWFIDIFVKFMKWLVCIDNSKDSNITFSEALKLINAETDELFIICLNEILESVLSISHIPTSILADASNEIEKELKRTLVRFGKIAREKKVFFFYNSMDVIHFDVFIPTDKISLNFWKNKSYWGKHMFVFKKSLYWLYYHWEKKYEWY